VTLEGLGIPTVTIVSTAFVNLALAQREGLKCPDLRLVVVPHPFKILTPEQAEDLARQFFRDVVSQLTQSGPTLIGAVPIAAGAVKA
jgi:hypothetical protein